MKLIQEKVKLFESENKIDWATNKNNIYGFDISSYAIKNSKKESFSGVAVSESRFSINALSRKKVMPLAKRPIPKTARNNKKKTFLDRFPFIP